jgi:periplasmic divalent cation tolerance protein
MSSPDVRVLYSTFPSHKEAEAVAAELLDRNLIACANLFGEVRSVFRWEGKVASETEVIMIAKTAAEKLDEAISQLTQLHSYDCPCVTSWPVTAGNAEYLNWVGDEVK